MSAMRDANASDYIANTGDELYPARASLETKRGNYELSAATLLAKEERYEKVSPSPRLSFISPERSHTHRNNSTHHAIVFHFMIQIIVNCYLC